MFMLGELTSTKSGMKKHKNGRDFHTFSSLNSHLFQTILLHMKLLS